MRKQWCSYCNNENANGQYCNVDCESKYAEFMEFHNKWFRKGIAIMIATMLLFIPGVFYFMYMPFFFGLGFLLLGIEVRYLPLTTIDSLRGYGVKRFIEMTPRWSLVLILIGVILIIIQVPISLL